MINNYDDYKLENIDKKVLIFHAENDPMASYESSVKAHKRLPNSEFHSFENGGHMIYGHEDEIKKILNTNFK
jgi:pimeloyl-ACP methyl ester carboxylesterase